MTRRSPIMRMIGVACVLEVGGPSAATPSRMAELRSAVEGLPPPVTDRDGHVRFGEIETVLRASACCVIERGLTPATHALLSAALKLARDTQQSPAAAIPAASARPKYWWEEEAAR